MGCTTSVVSITKTQLTPEPTGSRPGNVCEITKEDKRIVKKTWKFLSADIVELGVKVLLNLFELNPATKQTFRFQDLDDGGLLTNIRFKSHASRLMQTLQTVIENLDTLDTDIVPLLIEIGQQHYSFEGFHKSYWDSCPEAILRTWKEVLEENFTGPKYKAWSSLICFMIATLKDGYDTGAVQMIQTPK